MAQTKRIMISVPNKLLEEVDQVVQESNGNRSQFIREAVHWYILHKKRAVLRTTEKWISEHGSHKPALSRRRIR